VAAGVACAAAPTAQAADLSGLVPVAESPASVRDYWTQDRMADAIPVNPLAARQPAAERREGTAQRVKHVTDRPERTHGKVFFTLQGTRYVCSGTSVDAPSGRLVWTAGHCVFQPGGILSDGEFATKWEFVPAYRGGKKPFGEWPATGLGATTQWRHSGGDCLPGGLTACGDVRFDLAAATVARNGHGKTLKSVVGSRGIAFNRGRNQLYRGYGFPQEPPFDGEHMYRCKSHHAGDDGGMGAPKPLEFNCNMTGGSSGGGWVADGTVLSVVSYGYEGDSSHLYGPYQGSAAKSFYDNVKSG